MASAVVVVVADLAEVAAELARRPTGRPVSSDLWSAPPGVRMSVAADIASVKSLS